MSLCERARSTAQIALPVDLPKTAQPLPAETLRLLTVATKHTGGAALAAAVLQWAQLVIWSESALRWMLSGKAVPMGMWPNGRPMVVPAFVRCSTVTAQLLLSQVAETRQRYQEALQVGQTEVLDLCWQAGVNDDDTEERRKFKAWTEATQQGSDHLANVLAGHLLPVADGVGQLVLVDVDGRLGPQALAYRKRLAQATKASRSAN